MATPSNYYTCSHMGFISMRNCWVPASVCVCVCFSLLCLFKLTPSRLGFKPVDQSAMSHDICFYPLSRSHFVIYEHQEAPQAVGVPNDPVNQVILMQLSDIFFHFLSWKLPSSVGLVDSPSHLLDDTWAYSSGHVFIGATHSGRGGFRTFLPQYQCSPQPQIKATFLRNPLLHTRIPSGLISRNHGTTTGDIKLQDTDI